MELDTKDKDVLLGIKRAMASQKDIINEMYLKEQDADIKGRLGAMADALSDSICNANIITNRIK